jgi:hypothetical protein
MLTGTAQAAPAYQFNNIQSGWWWCGNCSCLFHSGNGAPAGYCLATLDNHVSGGGTEYEVPNGGPAQSGTQNMQVGWRWCADCDLLFWGGGVASSACAAHRVFVNENFYYAPHTFGSSTIYDMMNGVWTLPALQVGWRVCETCQNLVWGNEATACFCAGGWGTKDPYHVIGTTDYYLLEL